MGFVGYGLLHLAIAWLAVQIALGNTATSGDQSGALDTLVAQPFGRFLLWLIIVGLCAMAIWQLLVAAIGYRDKQGKSRVMQRVASGARALVYAALAFTAIKVVVGAGASSGDQQQNAAAGIMAKPAGQFLIGLAGLVVVAAGVGLIFYGAKRKFEDKLLIDRMSHRVRQLARRLGQGGYVAKGVGFAIVGVLLLDAAITHNPAKSRGLDAALRALAHQPFGVFLLIAVGIGFAAFGLYCFIEARYRKVGS
jgi:hypothetical protein